jgi:DnaJ-domain-containing protein 1
MYSALHGNIRNMHAGFAASNVAGSALNYGRSLEEERKGHKNKAAQFRNSAKLGLVFAGLNGAQAYSNRHMTGFKSSTRSSSGRGYNRTRSGSNTSVKDPFKDLGVSPKATDAEIKKAWLNLMRKHHPDAGGDPEEAKKVNAAFQEILRRRGIKDADLDAVFDADFDSVWAYGFQP